MQKRKNNNTTGYVPASMLEVEPITQQHTRTDIQEVIKDCLSRCSKDGIAWKRMEDIENCFLVGNVI